MLPALTGDHWVIKSRWVALTIGPTSDAALFTRGGKPACAVAVAKITLTAPGIAVSGGR